MLGTRLGRGGRRTAPTPPPLTHPARSPALYRYAATNQRMAEYRTIFNMFDADGGGSIDREEFRFAMHCMDDQMSEDTVDEFLAIADENGAPPGCSNRERRPPLSLAHASPRSAPPPTTQATTRSSTSSSSTSACRWSSTGRRSTTAARPSGATARAPAR